jgi:anti-sigma regulatory factor (Ser/Thr protein kinase)
MLYGSPDGFATGVADFVRAGTEAGEAVLVAAAGPNLRRIRAQLDGQGRLVRWAEVPGVGISPARLTSALWHFAKEHRGMAVRCVQDAGWRSRSAGELREAVRHEALMNQLLSQAPVTVLCAYDAELDAATQASAQRAHPELVREGRWQPNPGYGPHDTAPQIDEPPADAPPGAAALAYRDGQAAVRAFAADQARRAGLPADRVTDLVIAVAELAGNTLEHTDGPGEVSIWTQDGELICQVHDLGHISDPLAGIRRPDPAAPGRKRGLWVVHQLVDLAEVWTGPGGTTIRLHMHLPS